jgi:hypothetical protein
MAGRKYTVVSGDRRCRQLDYLHLLSAGNQGVSS